MSDTDERISSLEGIVNDLVRTVASLKSDISADITKDIEAYDLCCCHSMNVTLNQPNITVEEGTGDNLGIFNVVVTVTGSANWRVEGTRQNEIRVRVVPVNFRAYYRSQDMTPTTRAKWDSTSRPSVTIEPDSRAGNCIRGPLNFTLTIKISLRDLIDMIIDSGATGVTFSVMGSVKASCSPHCSGQGSPTHHTNFRTRFGLGWNVQNNQPVVNP